jgi:hypothetical protein
MKDVRRMSSKVALVMGRAQSRAGHTAAFHRSISCLAHRLRALVIRLWNLLIHSLLV